MIERVVSIVLRHGKIKPNNFPLLTPLSAAEIPKPWKTQREFKYMECNMVKLSKLHCLSFVNTPQRFTS